MKPKIDSLKGSRKLITNIQLTQPRIKEQNQERVSGQHYRLKKLRVTEYYEKSKVKREDK